MTTEVNGGNVENGEKIRFLYVKTKRIEIMSTLASR